MDGVLGGCGTDLGGDAADVETCAAKATTPLDAGDLEAQLASFDGGNIATWATTDDHHVLGGLSINSRVWHAKHLHVPRSKPAGKDQRAPCMLVAGPERSPDGQQSPERHRPWILGQPRVQFTARHSSWYGSAGVEWFRNVQTEQNMQQGVGRDDFFKGFVLQLDIVHTYCSAVQSLALVHTQGTSGGRLCCVECSTTNDEHAERPAAHQA